MLELDKVLSKVVLISSTVLLSNVVLPIKQDLLLEMMLVDVVYQIDVCMLFEFP